jgi:hypothetical protein
LAGAYFVDGISLFQDKVVDRKQSDEVARVGFIVLLGGQELGDVVVDSECFGWGFCEVRVDGCGFFIWQGDDLFHKFLECFVAEMAMVIDEARAQTWAPGEEGLDLGQGLQPTKTSTSPSATVISGL